MVSERVRCLSAGTAEDPDVLRSSSEMAVEGFEGWGFFDMYEVSLPLALSAEQPRRKLEWQ